MLQSITPLASFSFLEAFNPITSMIKGKNKSNDSKSKTSKTDESKEIVKKKTVIIKEGNNDSRPQFNGDPQPKKSRPWGETNPQDYYGGGNYWTSLMKENVSWETTTGPAQAQATWTSQM